ncbi:hypothetical protein IWW38_006084, partial [Coemansia aciculifera]
HHCMDTLKSILSYFGLISPEEEPESAYEELQTQKFYDSDRTLAIEAASDYVSTLKLSEDSNELMFPIF